MIGDKDATAESGAVANAGSIGGSVHIGITLEEHRTALKEDLAKLKKKLKRKHAAENALLTGEIAELAGKLGNIDQDYQETIQELAALKIELRSFSNDFEADRLKAAFDALDKGDRTQADALFAEVEFTEQPGISRAARAAFARGEIAEQEVRWADAARHYSRAVALDATADNLGRAQVLSWRSGDYETAIHFGKRRLQLHQKQDGPKSANFATALNDQALSLHALARLKEAEPLFRQAIEIDKKMLGEEHPDFASHLNNLAGLLHALGRYNEAEPLFRQAIEIGKKTLGEEHPNYAIRLNNLAGLLQDLGRYDEAGPLFRQAIEIDKKALGEEHPNYAIRLNNLAGLLQDLGRYDEAGPLYRQAIGIDKKTLGEMHPQYATHLNNLARLLRALGRFDEAEPLYRQAVVILEGALGAEHPNTKTVRGNYEAFLAEKG